MTVMTAQTYKQPPFFVAKVMNPLIAGLTRLGMSPRGAHVLATMGRTTGSWRTTPVNPMEYEGNRYLVAPRGSTHWARNLLAHPEGELRLGRKREQISAELVPVEERARLLRAYLDRWSPETASHFGVSKDISVEELEKIADRHPVFRIL
jgi:deazaflavin-dependent oxidoreductase (nitroreductase family)